MERDQPFRIQVVTRIEELAALGTAWSNLLETAAPGRIFFYRVESLRALEPVHAAPTHPGGRRSLFFLLAWQGSALVGALPLVLERKPLTRAGLRRLLLWAGDGGALGAAGEVPIAGDDTRRRQVAEAFREALAGPLARSFDLLELGNVREDSPALPALRAAFADGRWEVELSVSHHCALDQPFEAYRASRSGSRLRELGRLRRRLEAVHTVAIREVERLSEEELAEVVALHESRQRELTARGWRRDPVFERPYQRRALSDLLEIASNHGRARHWLLYADGTLISFLLNFQEGTTLIGWLTAVREDAARFSPGGILLWEAVQREYARGDVQRIELGAGTTFVKETVGTHVLRPQRLVWQPPGRPIARARVAAYRALIAGKRRLLR